MKRKERSGCKTSEILVEARLVAIKSKNSLKSNVPRNRMCMFQDVKRCHI